MVPTALTGCGLLEGSEGASEGNGQVETAKLQVGTMPIVGAAPLGLAHKKGWFKENSLDVTTKLVKSGADALPTLVGGDLHVTFSNYVSFIKAKAEGIDVRIIAEGSRSAPENFAIVTRKDTDIHEPKDLRGKRIGVNALKNIATLTTSSVLRSHGVRSDEVEYIEFPFPDMAATLDRGDIDAAFLPEPFLTQAKIGSGVRTILDPCSGATENLPIDGYGVTGEFADKNPKTIQAFQKSLLKAQEACSDQAVLQPQLVETTKVDEKTAALVSRSVYPISLNEVGLQRVADLMLEFNAIGKKVDVAEMVVQHKA